MSEFFPTHPEQSGQPHLSHMQFDFGHLLKWLSGETYGTASTPITMRPPSLGQHSHLPQLAAYSEASDLHPDYNEDAFFIDETALALGVLDGMGSLKGSGKASHIASSVIAKTVRTLPMDLPHNIAEVRMTRALETGNDAVVREIRRSGLKMGTTATIGKVFLPKTESPYIVIPHTGDSRAYLLRRNRLSFLTLDHSKRIEGYDPHRLQRKLAHIISATDHHLTPQELEAFKQRRGIWSFLGSDKTPFIEVNSYALQEGDRILLTTDGVHDNLTHLEIQNILIEAPTPTIAVRSVVKAAKNRSRDRAHMRAKDDDMTAAGLYF